MRRTAPTRPITSAQIDAICQRLRRKYGANTQNMKDVERAMMADLIVIVREQTLKPWEEIGMLLGVSYSHARKIYKTWWAKEGDYK